MKRIVLLMTIAIAGNGSGQAKHAATPEQCRADAAAWRTDLQTPSAVELAARGDEMFDCQQVDPENKSRYNNVVAATALEIGKRHTNFLRRHKLLKQFEAEDAKGAR